MAKKQEPKTDQEPTEQQPEAPPVEEQLERPTIAKEEQIASLLSYLKSTGTGESKLQAIAALARKCDTPEEFLSRLGEVANPITIAKINEFVANQATAP